VGQVEGRDDHAERWRGLMIASQAGDAGAYRELLAELLPVVRRIARSRTRDATVAEDITQEVLLRIHVHRATYRPERPLLPWVRAITRNAVVDWARRQTRRREVALDQAGDPADPALAQAAVLLPGLERALGRLPAPQRQAVVMLKLEGLSVAEAAERAGVSSGAIKLRAHRGYRALRDLLGRELP
jgi:RNA polymerase sigma-70 factor (ECF subfamily)